MLATHAWRQAGSISIWRYTRNQRNFPGWHLSVDAAGGASLVALLDAFATDGLPASRALVVEAPSPGVLAVPNNRSAGVFAPDRMILAFSGRVDHWALGESPKGVELSIGADWLPVLRKAVVGMSRGEGDHSIGATRESQLWFWWRAAQRAGD